MRGDDRDAALARARPGQPDRRAHRLQRGIRAAVRDRGRLHATVDARRRAGAADPLRAARRHRRRSRSTISPRDAAAGSATRRAWCGRCASAGTVVPGVDLALDSTVPSGSGLSSSAALVCSVTDRARRPVRPRTCPTTSCSRCRARRERLRRRADRRAWTSSRRCAAPPDTRCSATCARSRSTRCPSTSPPQGLTVLVIDTRAEHSHADGEYRQRREGCERAAATARRAALRDVADRRPRRRTRPAARRRAAALRAPRRHRGRPRAAHGRAAARRPARATSATLLTASHASMRDDYRITIPELDVAADTLVAAGALGARMTGGGFGGCVIAPDRRRTSSTGRRPWSCRDRTRRTGSAIRATSPSVPAAVRIACESARCAVRHRVSPCCRRASVRPRTDVAARSR